MLKQIVLAAFLAVTPILVSAEPTSAQMAETLDKSVAHLSGVCTATKIAPKTWLTAGHCVGYGMKLELSDGSYLFPRSVTVAISKKEDGRRYEDWAIVHTSSENPDIPALPLACGMPLYAGQKVAYLGFPTGVDRGYMEGYISTVRKPTHRFNNADYVIDVPVAGGASGSALVDFKTGKILGVITEGVYSNRSGFYMAAAESINNLDLCEDYNSRLQPADDGVHLDPSDAPVDAT